MTTLLVWWMCSYGNCVFHQSTFSDLQACQWARMTIEDSVCLETGKAA